MLIKSKKIILFFIVIFMCSFLYSCVDEPYIEHIKMPYTAFQVANFISNTENVTINIKDPADNSILVGGVSLAYGSKNSYSDISSGARIVEIKDPAGNVLYSNEVTFGSYDESIIMFFGAYDENPDLSSIAPINIFNGATYLDDYFPPADSSIVAFVNASYTDGINDPYTFRNVILENTATGEIDTVIFNADIPTREYSRAVVKNGNYNMKFVNIAAAVETEITSGDVNISSGKLSFVIMCGMRDNESVSAFNENPVNSRSK